MTGRHNFVCVEYNSILLFLMNSIMISFVTLSNIFHFIYSKSTKYNSEINSIQHTAMSDSGSIAFQSVFYIVLWNRF